MSLATTYDSRIYKQARSGSPVNKGFPDPLARLVVAQARHETGNYLSNGFKTGNNLFGYMYVKGARYQLPDPGLIADNKKPLAKYSSLENSVNELLDWIYRRVADKSFPSDLSTIRTPEQYASYLKSAGYYGDSVENYAGGLSRGLKAASLEGPGESKILAVGAGVFVLSILALYFIVRPKTK